MNSLVTIRCRYVPTVHTHLAHLRPSPDGHSHLSHALESALCEGQTGRPIESGNCSDKKFFAVIEKWECSPYCSAVTEDLFGERVMDCSRRLIK
jgi:hypothetical protein